MNKEEYAEEIEDLFQQTFEKTLSSMIEQHPQFDGYTTCALVGLQDDILQSEIKRRNKYFSKSRLVESVYQTAEYNRALVYQLHYVLTEGDFSNMSGYDMTTNTFTAQNELAARTLSPRAKMILTCAGLLCRVVGGSDSYWERRRRF